MLIQNLKQKIQNHSQKPKNDLKQRVYRFSINIVNFLNGFLKEKRSLSNEIMIKQLLRSSTSIGANVIEAHGSSSKKDFANFFTHALKSANETKYWLGLLRDTNQTRNKEINSLLQEAIELSNILATSLITIRGKR